MPSSSSPTSPSSPVAGCCAATPPLTAASGTRSRAWSTTSVSGAAVPLDRAQPARLRRHLEPADRGRGRRPGRHRACLRPALPAPASAPHIDRRDHAASAQIAFRFNSFICLRPGRPDRGARGPADDRGAHRRLRADVQHRRGLAHGAARADRPRAPAAAQPADHRHRHRAGRQPAGAGRADLARADAARASARPRWRWA